MKPSTHHPRAGKHLARRIVAGATLVSFLGASPYTMAAGLTDISNAPLASSSTAQIPPNVMFILDASGSMNSLHMPDDISGKYDSERVGSVSHYCNTLYFNPAVTYPPAKNANGTLFPAASFAAAENDPFSSNDPSGTTDLRTKYRPWGGWDNDQRGFYVRYNGTWDPRGIRPRRMGSARSRAAATTAPGTMARSPLPPPKAPPGRRSM